MTKEELEKEAEEWVKENMDCCKTDNSVNQSIPYFDEEERCIAKSAFQDGAEFGYNKAKAEIKLLKETHRQSLKILTDQIEELHKANEWHYPSKGKYPKEYKDILICFLTEDDMKDCVRGWYEYDFENDKHIFKYLNVLGTQYLKTVIAWKEIVLPELPKESE